MTSAETASQRSLAEISQFGMKCPEGLWMYSQRLGERGAGGIANLPYGRAITSFQHVGRHSDAAGCLSATQKEGIR